MNVDKQMFKFKVTLIYIYLIYSYIDNFFTLHI